MHLLLVGTGDAARHHARAVLTLLADPAAPPLRWSLVARSPARAEALLAPIPPDLHPAAIYPSLEAALDDRDADLHAAILATPDGLHAAQIRACAAAGLHVLCEKPLALTAADAISALDACRTAGVRLQLGYQLRYHAAHRYLRDHLSRIGKLVRVEARWDWPDPAVGGWRAQATAGLARDWAMAAVGTHALDLIGWYGGLSAIRAEDLQVRALRCALPSGADLCTDLLISAPVPAPDLADPASPQSPLSPPLTAHLSASVGWRSASRLSLLGTEGEWEAIGSMGARGTGLLRWRSTRGEEETIPLPLSAPYTDQLRDFLAAGGPDPAEAAWNVAVMERIAGAVATVG